MNAKKFSDAMSELDTKYVDEALNYKKRKQERKRRNRIGLSGELWQLAYVLL